MTHALVTVALPFSSHRAAAVGAAVQALGQHPGERSKLALDRTGIVHYTNLSVVPASAPDIAHLAIEIVADGGPEDAASAFCDALRPMFADLLRQASIELGAMSAPAYLVRRNQTPGQRSVETARSRFPVLPYMTIYRINNESRIARDIGEMRILGDVTSPTCKLDGVRIELWKNNEKWAFTAAPAPFLARPGKVDLGDHPVECPTTEQADGAFGAPTLTGPEVPIASFSYAAHPSLSIKSIRRNAAIRLGIATARTEAEAEEWLACFDRRSGAMLGEAA